MKINRYNVKKGFSLTELLLVLGFVAVAIAAAFIAYQKVQTSSTINENVKAAATLSSEIQSLFASTDSYADLTTKVAIDAGLIPKIYKVDGSGQNVTSTFDTAVNFSGDNESFTIEYEGLSKEMCTRFATAAAGIFDGVEVAGTLVKSDTTPELDVAGVATGCAGNSNGISVSLMGGYVQGGT